jgi:hypothetical protein
MMELDNTVTIAESDYLRVSGILLVQIRRTKVNGEIFTPFIEMVGRIANNEPGTKITDNDCRS